MRGFQKVFSKIYIIFLRILRQHIGYFLRFSKNVSDEHTYHFCLKSPPPGILAFTPSKSLRRKDNNYLEKFDTC